MTDPFDRAVAALRRLRQRVELRDESVLEVCTIIEARDQVLRRYQRVFSKDHLSAMTEEDFRQFLHFKNNKHWMALQRMGPSICADMDRLRTALERLLDESTSLAERLNGLVPIQGPAYVPRLSKAVLTPILLICFPERYGVWNQVSEGAMKTLGIWPRFERGLPFGERYERVNDVLLQVSGAVEIDLWSLDALWWIAEQIDLDGEGPDDDREDEESRTISVPSARFGLERHLHEFLRDNWEHTDLAVNWSIYQEDGDPDAGYEYPCGIGRIDLLAKHRREPRWLVIELKRHQTSDQTVGQVLRYMGWVQSEMAAEGESVEGLIIAHEADAPVRFALRVTPGVSLRLYEVEFRLTNPTAHPHA